MAAEQQLQTSTTRHHPVASPATEYVISGASIMNRTGSDQLQSVQATEQAIWKLPQGVPKQAKTTIAQG